MWGCARARRLGSRQSNGRRAASRELRARLPRRSARCAPPEAAPTYKPAIPFGELHIFQSMNKHRSVASMFGLKNPFYRAHDGRLGATAMHEGRELINFASYDYLGLNQEPAVAEAAKAAIDECGTSVSASRLVAGERMMHRELEKELADFYGSDACLTFVSGHATNISTIGMLMAPEDLIVQDELMHNSAIVGAKLSRATSINFRHNDLDDLEKVLRENREKHKNALIVAEGLYSMDGDFPDLPRLIEIKKRYGCLADDRRGAFARRHGQDRARLVRALRRRPAPGRHLDGHAQQDAGQLRRLHLRQPRSDRDPEVPGARVRLLGRPVASGDRSRPRRAQDPQVRSGKGRQAPGQRPLLRRGGEEGRPRHDDQRGLLGGAGHDRRSRAGGAPDGQAAWSAASTRCRSFIPRCR